MSVPEHFNCPQCGAPVELSLRFSKMVVCASCNSTLFLEDDAVRNAGIQSSVQQTPSLLSVGTAFSYNSWTFVPIGRVRFEYTGGYWDEWWVNMDTGVSQWMSIDEGDIALEITKDLSSMPDVGKLKLGRTIAVDGVEFSVTERHEATCIGMEGELPEVIFPGDVHQYAHLSASRGRILTAEWFKEDRWFYEGRWIDPFEIKQL